MTVHRAIMCEPVYHNTWHSSEATTTESHGAFLTGTKLTEAVYDIQRVLKRTEPAKELTDKYRYT